MQYDNSKKMHVEIREEADLFDTSLGSCFDKSYHDEFREIDKHEILVKICDMMGPCPSNFTSAEKIFEAVKLEIAQYVIHHEYRTDNSIRSKLSLWFDSRLNPDNVTKCKVFYEKFFR